MESTQGKDYEMQFKKFLDRGKISELTSLLNDLGKKEEFNQNVKWIIIKFKGIVQLHIGNYQIAIKILNSAIEYYKKADENFQCIDCILNRGEAYHFLGKYDLVLEEINKPHILVMLITGLEINYLTKEDLQTAISVFSKNIGTNGIITQIIEYLK